MQGKFDFVQRLLDEEEVSNNKEFNERLQTFQTQILLLVHTFREECKSKSQNVGMIEVFMNVSGYIFAGLTCEALSEEDQKIKREVIKKLVSNFAKSVEDHMTIYKRQIGKK